ncbi:hypothetical protein [Haladaptatus cibarius]|uniref:hypothetical protein n=1 Tax=Haladaptatus cibarius TaxID=453847 RepID=UPI001186FFE5|nr:hypothetical protein [Haladaptatus cibarius]
MVEKSRLNRRDILKGIGATASAASFTSVPVVAKGATNYNRLNRARGSEYVRSILTELNYPKLKLEGSQEYEIEGSDGKTLQVAEFSTLYGMLYYVESENTDTGAIFRFSDEKLSSIDRSQLPERYQSLPSGTNAVLLGRTSDVVFRRNATDGEQAVVEKVDGVVADDAAVVTGTDISGYKVLHSKDTDSETLQTVVVDEGISFTPMKSMADQLSAERLSVQDQIGAQWHNSCVLPCGGCVGSVGGCWQCSPACIDAPTGIGAVDCAVCLYLICHGALIAACGGCAHCVGQYV